MLYCKVNATKKKYQYQKQTLLSTDTLKDENKELLKIRVEAVCNVDVNLDTICTFHKYRFIDGCSRSYKSCCDVLDTHKKALRNSSLHVISLTWSHKVRNFSTIFESRSQKKNLLKLYKVEEFSLSANTLSSSANEEEEIQGVLNQPELCKV